MRKPIIAGNWKMNGTADLTEALITELLAGLSGNEKATMVICPPFPFLEAAHRLLSGSAVALGAQEMSAHGPGAYTGEVCAEMLLTVGVRYVILGHSERRQYHAETDRIVNAKARRALEASLIPIICVGESLQERERGETEQVVGRQIDGTLSELTVDELKGIVIAYEPIWAIGTGRTATPQMAQDVHRFIRQRLASRYGEAADAVRILYGGSVKPDNAAGLLREPDIDGALVGGASLKADDFRAIIEAV
ncbi:MAG TPA: triose-phosphate isomerase [Acidobacteriota bacterium]|nr:triose-phosphate isomerase [Acidobacteriota bacterium]